MGPVQRGDLALLVAEPFGDAGPRGRVVHRQLRARGGLGQQPRVRVEGEEERGAVRGDREGQGLREGGRVGRAREDHEAAGLDCGDEVIAVRGKGEFLDWVERDVVN